MTIKPEDMNPRDLKKAIKSSYGKILEDWKSVDLIPSKDTLFVEGVSPFAVPFILENYDLSADEFILIRNTISKADLPEDVLDTLKDILKEKSIPVDWVISKDPLSPQEMCLCLKNKEFPYILPENNSWEFLEKLNKEIDVFDPFTIPHVFFNDFQDYIRAIIKDTDFTKIDDDNHLFKDINKNIIAGSLDPVIFFENPSFLKKFCLSYAGEDFSLNLSIYNVKKFEINDPTTASMVLRWTYLNSKKQFLREKKQTEDILLERQKDLDKDPEYKARFINSINEGKKAFIEEQNLYGKMGLFSFGHEDFDEHRDFFYKFEKFLSLEKINDITEGNTLHCLPIEKVPENLNKIQHLMLNSLKHKVNYLNMKCSTSVWGLGLSTKFFPEGGERAVFTTGFLKSLSEISKTKEEELNSRNEIFFGFHRNDNFFKQDIKNRILKIIKEIPKTNENLEYLNRNLLMGGLSYLSLYLNIETKKAPIPSSMSEYQDVFDKYAPDFISQIKDNFDLMDINNTLTFKSNQDLNMLVDNFTHLLSKGTDTDSVSKEFLKKIESNVLKEKDVLSLDEAYFCLMFGFSHGEIVSRITEDDLLNLKQLTFVNDGNQKPLNNSKIPLGKNSIKNKFNKDNEFAIYTLLKSTAFQEKVLNEDLKIKSDSIIALLEEVTFMDYEDEKELKSIKSIEKFVVEYIQRNPEQEDLKAISMPDGWEDVMPSLYNVLNSTFSIKSLVKKAYDEKKFEVINECFKTLNFDVVELIKEINKNTDIAFKREAVTLLKGKVSFSDFFEAGFDNHVLVDVSLGKQDILKKLSTVSLSEVPQDFKDVMRDRLLKINNNGMSKDLFEFLGALTQGHKNFKYPYEFIKENAPCLLVNKAWEYAYNNHESENLISLEDVVLAVKDLYKKSKLCTNILHSEALQVDTLLFNYPKNQDWDKHIKDLSEEEKILMIKYGSFAAEKPSVEYSDKYRQQASLIFKNPPTKDNQITYSANKLALSLPEVFQENFIEKNRLFIKSVYFNSVNLSKYEMINSLGEASMYPNPAKVDVSFIRFKGESAWIDIAKEVIFTNNSDFHKYVNPYFKSAPMKEAIKEHFSLDTEHGIERFFLMIEKSSHNDEGFVLGGEFKNKFDEFLDDVSNSFVLASEDMQAKFVKFYDNLTIGFKASPIKSRVEKLFLENKELLEKVQKVKLHNRLLKNMNSFDDGLSDEIDDNNTSFSI